MGCFDGASELLYEHHSPWNTLEFDNIEDAKEAGYAATSDGIWNFDVIDESRQVVFSSAN